MSQYARPLTPYVRLAIAGAGLYIGSKVLGTVQAWTGIAAFATLNFVLFLGAAVLGGMFMGRVGSNLDRLEHGDRTWSTALGVTLWYVPVVNLILPFFVLREWSRASSPDQQAPSYLPLMWGVWAAAGALVAVGVIWGIAGGAGAILDAGQNETAIEEAAAQVEDDQRVGQGILSTLSTVLVIAAFPLYLRLVRDLARWQDAQIEAKYV